MKSKCPFVRVTQEKSFLIITTRIVKNVPRNIFCCRRGRNILQRGMIQARASHSVFSARRSLSSVLLLLGSVELAGQLVAIVGDMLVNNLFLVVVVAILLIFFSLLSGLGCPRGRESTEKI